MDVSILTLLKTILQSLFAGFGIIIPIISLIKTSKLNAIRAKELFILQAVHAVRIGGIIYILLCLPDLYSTYMSTGANVDLGSGTGASVGVSYPEHYLLLLYYPPIMCLLLTQLFWIKKLYIKKFSLIVLSLFLLILPSPQFIMWVIMIPQKFIPSQWQQQPGNTLLRLWLDMVVFFFFIIILMVISGKFKNLREN
ncbi:hypothetical protein [Flavobacterium rhizosphaerae]|uniref:Uncharacterized protein n=1 Tax=Flavobacterium rhizosphaerae TaxID=3163298 RepID=A0ABW8YZN3_9FLAO